MFRDQGLAQLGNVDQVTGKREAPLRALAAFAVKGSVFNHADKDIYSVSVWGL